MNRIKEKLREYEENDYFDPEQIFHARDKRRVGSQFRCFNLC